MQTINHLIVYAEDDMDDLNLVKEAFSRQDGHTADIIHADNGLRALKLLEEMADKNELPCLIILDINMPVMDGKEALSRIRQHDRLKHIPVTVFTTSNSKMDAMFAHRYGADFITKPLRYAEVEELAMRFIQRCEVH
ncbi:MAG TPA: response regulator [Chitinophagaceae bacterium]|jgi:CheY-like chemotaxis protein|nr:response regulator [Chitinophagaceae bacterium]